MGGSSAVILGNGVGICRHLHHISDFVAHPFAAVVARIDDAMQQVMICKSQKSIVMDDVFNISLLILLIGSTIVAAMVTKAAFEKVGVSSLVGFILLGFFIGLADRQWNLLLEDGRTVYEFLAKLGIIVLLFRVGLESNIAKLFGQLRRASLIWIGDVLASGGLAFCFSYYIFGLSLIPSLFIASALTATSVGVSVGVWHEARATKSPLGETLIDVAELDDISGIFLMALLFAVVPVLRGAEATPLFSKLTTTAGIVFLKLLGFGTACAVFSFFLERHILDFFRRFESPPDLMLIVAGIGIILSALAGLLGLSVAVGAFFAGLTFSRDPKKVKIDASFNPLHDFLQPFFFIGIGLSMQVGTLGQALGLGSLLLIVAVFGKLVGDGAMTWATMGWRAATLVGISMIPRAEIALIIMQRGLHLGKWAVPSYVFSAMVLVSTVTVVGAPLVIRPLLRLWPQEEH